MDGKALEQIIFDSSISFEKKAILVFQYQYQYIPVYQSFCDYLSRNPSCVSSIHDIPFLPVEMFKYHTMLSTEAEYETIFRSSKTTGEQASEHFIASCSLYERAILQGFTSEYGDPSNYCILGLLPSYLERDDASLVYMVNYLMSCSGHKDNGFYLHNYKELAVTLSSLIAQGQQVILFGVSFALLDMAEQVPMDLGKTIIIETGGMKGKRKEMIREELHGLLKDSFQVEHIHSEYGMTECLSQAYYQQNNRFSPSSTMQIIIREIQDPFHFLPYGKSGAINIIDLANIYSCSFLATQDIGKVYENNQFEVLGRTDFSDIRGCNLMVE